MEAEFTGEFMNYKHQFMQADIAEASKGDQLRIEIEDNVRAVSGLQSKSI